MPRVSGTESELIKLLEKRYPAPEWFLIPKVSNGPGSGQTRVADALALNRWATRGLTIHGFEIKCERRDWLRELRAPAKAEGVGIWCDYWWLVTAEPGMARLEELPEGWGLLVQQGKTEKRRLSVAKQAVKQKHQRPIDRQFLIAVANALERQWGNANVIIEEANEAYRRGVEDGKGAVEMVEDHVLGRLEELKKRVLQFEQASGLSLSEASLVGRIGEAVRLLMRSRGAVRTELQNSGRRMREVLALVDRAAEALKEERDGNTV